MVRTRYGSLGILGHSLRNKIQIVGNQGESEVRVKKIHAPECYESGEVRVGMKKKRACDSKPCR